MSVATPPRPLAYIAGPTAVGKSSIALHWAAEAGLEVLSLDSRQVYRQLDLGTAKPSEEELARVPHHLINCFDVDEACSAGSFAELYEGALADLASRKQIGLAVGGTGFYWEACSKGLHELPTASPELRKELDERIAEAGLEGLYHDLVCLDPVGAANVPADNRHRLMRAVELVRTAGRPLAEIYAGERRVVPGDEVPVFYLTRPRAQVYARIEKRCDQMLSSGLLDEIRQLLLSGWTEDMPGLQTVGYREFFDHLRGEETLASARERFLIHTRRYAKRQETWFRNRVPERIEIELETGETIEAIVERMRTRIGR